MNRVYKTKYDVLSGQCVAVSEITSSKKKSGVKNLLSIVALTGLLSITTGVAYASPVIKTDSDVVGGVITVTEAEVASVGTVTLPNGPGGTAVGNGGIDVRASGANSIVIEGGNADISTSGGVKTYGIYAGVAAGGTGDIAIGSVSKPLSGSIETTDTGANSFSIGLLVDNKGTGKTSIYSSANIDTYGRGSRGIQVLSTNAAGGDIIIESSGNITLHSDNNPYAAIQVEDKGVGNIYVTSSGDMIGQNAAGNKNSIFIHKDIDTTGNINIGYAGDGSVKAITGTLTALGAGWQIYGWHRGTGNINIQVGNATIKNGVDAATTDSTIFAHYAPDAAVTTKASNILVNVGQANIDHTGAGDSAGIEARHDGELGDITINSSANVTTKGTDADGIMARYTQAIQNGKIVVNNAGNITTNGNQSKGIYAYVDHASGTADISVKNSGGITTLGDSSSGIHAKTTGSTELINTSTGVIHTGNAPLASGIDAYGMHIEVDNAATKTLYIENAGKITTEWKRANGINVAFSGAGSASSLNIVNSGTIVTGSQSQATDNGLGMGIYVVAPDSPVTVDNSGTITTNGASHAIYVNGGKISTTINNTGNINLTPQGIQGWGIGINQTTGNATININAGTITTYDSQSLNAGARNGNSLITTAAGSKLYSYKSDPSNTTLAASGPEVSARVDGTTAEIRHHGYLEIGAGGSDGLIAWVPENNKQVTTRIEIGSTGVVNAQKGKNGMDVQGDYKNNVDIFAGGQVHGGSVAGIMIRSKVNGSAPDSVVNNAGVIDAMSDKAIANVGYDNTTSTAGTLAINNTGTMTGYVSLSNEDTTFTNGALGSWDIRNFADTDADGVRDTKAVAISNFGTGNDVFVNAATGTVRLAAVSSAATTVTTGEYVPAGALSSSQSGIVHGQLLNLNRFENAVICPR